MITLVATLIVQVLDPVRVVLVVAGMFLAARKRSFAEQLGIGALVSLFASITVYAVLSSMAAVPDVNAGFRLVTGFISSCVIALVWIAVYRLFGGGRQQSSANEL